jgi:hypothetical protein
MGSLTNYTRLTCSFAAANQGSCTNIGAATFGPFSSVGSAIAALIFDGSPVGSSNNLIYATLQTARTFGVGDSLIFSAGALTVQFQ